MRREAAPTPAERRSCFKSECPPPQAYAMQEGTEFPGNWLRREILQTITFDPLAHSTSRSWNGSGIMKASACFEGALIKSTENIWGIYHPQTRPKDDPLKLIASGFAPPHPRPRKKLVGSKMRFFSKSAEKSERHFWISSLLRG